MSEPVLPTVEKDACICPPDYCLGAESDTLTTIECAACVALDPELPCLHDPEVVYVIPPGVSP